MERRARAGFDGEHFNVLPEGVFEGTFDFHDG